MNELMQWLMLKYRVEAWFLWHTGERFVILAQPAHWSKTDMHTVLF